MPTTMTRNYTGQDRAQDTRTQTGGVLCIWCMSVDQLQQQDSAYQQQWYRQFRVLLEPPRRLYRHVRDRARAIQALLSKLILPPSRLYTSCRLTTVQIWKGDPTLIRSLKSGRRPCKLFVNVLSDQRWGCSPRPKGDWQRVEGTYLLAHPAPERRRVQFLRATALRDARKHQAWKKSRRPRCPHGRLRLKSTH